ncbi:MAG: hypothetical protein R6V07_05510 [Armatimonadota bacterium]
MKDRLRIGAFACVTALAVILLTGCAREEPVEIETTEDLLEAPAPPEPPDEERAAEIVAGVTHAVADDVTIIDQAAAGDTLTIEATIPAHEDVLSYAAATPGEGADVEQRIEWVTVRWNMAAERPEDITWAERLQFAEEEPIGEDEAVEVARELRDAWFPDVPPEMVMQPPHRMNRPVWAITWRGETEGDVLTGDQVAVQVSAVTGLPIAYSQRVAAQRPSPDEVELTRDEAIELVREALVEEGEEGADGMPLVARLVLSAPAHPEGGPAWLVRGTGRRAALGAPVDAMTGEVITAANDGEGRRTTADGGNDSND